MDGIKVAVIGGAGKMGTALVDGLLVREKIGASDLVVTARHATSLTRLAERGLRTTLENAQAAREAKVIFLAVEPDAAASAMAQMSGSLSPGQLLISIVTGLSTRRIEEMSGFDLPVIRANPNIAALVHQSATIICRGRHATDEHVTLALGLLEAVGRVEELDERHMNASTGLGGCGPAFAFKVIEALAEGGVKMGLPRDVSRRVAAQVLLGAATLVLETGKHPAALKDEVTTPGGCTIDGLVKLEERGLPIALIDAVEVSTRKAGLLSRAKEEN
ncbi:MAG: pyrroline-5-carboxylate reductase [Myxococcota bacterium]|jgi:pyrroline-5-carboxylate reductase|nr:pyrroline-5-carboxylate reductase [Myxococcota bacterium]